MKTLFYPIESSSRFFRDLDDVVLGKQFLEEENGFTLKVAVPGLTKNDLNVT